MITETEQFTLDIEWFFTDGNFIAFVTSAGGRLPNAISKSKENVETLANYLGDLPIICEAAINPNLSRFIKKKDIDDQYLYDYIHFGMRGFYTYDKTTPGNFADDNFHLVTIPKTPLKLNDLPSEIKAIIHTNTTFEIGEPFKVASFG